MTTQQQQLGNIAAPDSFVSARIFIRALRFVPENQLSLLLGREYDRIHPQIIVSAYFDGENYSTTPYHLYHLANDQTRIYQFCDIDEEFYILFDSNELLQHPNPNKHRKGVTFIVKLNPGGRELGKLLIKLNAIQPYNLDQGYQEFQLGHSSMRLGMEITIMEVSDIPTSRVDYGRYKPQKQRMFVMSREEGEEEEEEEQDQYYLQQQSQGGYQNSRDAASSRQTSHDLDVVVPQLVRPGSAQQQLLEQRQQREAHLTYLRKMSPRGPQSPRSDLFYLKKNQQPQEIVIQEQPVDQPSDVAQIVEYSEDENSQNGIKDNRSFLQKVNPAFLKPFGRSKKQAKGDTSNNVSESVDQQVQPDTFTAQSSAQFIAFDNNNNNTPHNNSPQSSQHSPRNQYPSPLQPVPTHSQPPMPPQNNNDHHHAHNDQHQQNVQYANNGQHQQNAQYAINGQHQQNVQYANSDRETVKSGSRRRNRQQIVNQEAQIQSEVRKGKKGRQRGIKKQSSSENNQEGSEFDTLGSRNSSKNISTDGEISPRRNQRSASSKNSETKQKSSENNNQNHKPSSQMVNAEVQMQPKMVDQEVLVETLKPKQTRDFWAQVSIGPSRSNSPLSSSRSLSSRSLSTRSLSRSLKNSPRMRDTGVQPSPEFQNVNSKSTLEMQVKEKKIVQYSDQGTQVENSPAVVVQEVEKIVPFVLYIKDPPEDVQYAQNVQQQAENQGQVNQKLVLQNQNSQKYDQSQKSQQNLSLQLSKNAARQSEFGTQDNQGEEFQNQESPKFIGEDFQSQDYDTNDNNNNNNDAQYQQQQYFDALDGDININNDTINYTEIGVDSYVADSPRYIPPSREVSMSVEGELIDYNETVTFDLSKLSEEVQSNQKDSGKSGVKKKYSSADFQFQVDAKEEELQSPTQSSSAGIRSIFNSWRRKSKTDIKTSVTEPIPEISVFSQGESEKNRQDTNIQDEDDDSEVQQSNLVEVSSISQDVQNAINASYANIIGTDEPNNNTNIIAPRTSIDTQKQQQIQIQSSIQVQEKVQIGTQSNNQATLDVQNVQNVGTSDVQNVQNVGTSDVRNVQNVGTGGLVIAPCTSIGTMDSIGTVVDTQQQQQRAQIGSQFGESGTIPEGQIVKQKSSDGDFESIVDDDSERFQSIGERKMSKKFRIIPVKKVSVGTDPMESLLNQVKLNRWRVRRARERGDIPSPPVLPPERLWTERAQQYRARQQLEYESQLTIENVRHIREKYGDEEDEEEYWEEGKQQKQGSYKGSGKRSAVNDDPMYLNTATRGRLIQPSDKIRCLSPQQSRRSFRLSNKGTGTIDDRTSNYSEEHVSAKMGGGLSKLDNTDNMSDMSAPVSLNHVEMSNEPREFPKHVPDWASIKLRRTFEREHEVDIDKLEQEIAQEEEGDVMLPETVSTNNRTLASGIHHSTPAHRITPQVLGEAIQRRNQEHTRSASQASLLSAHSTVSLRRIQKEQKNKEEEDKTQLDGSLGWKVQALIGVFDQSQN